MRELSGWMFRDVVFLLFKGFIISKSSELQSSRGSKIIEEEVSRQMLAFSYKKETFFATFLFVRNSSHNGTLIERRLERFINHKRKIFSN